MRTNGRLRARGREAAESGAAAGRVIGTERAQATRSCGRGTGRNDRARGAQSAAEARPRRDAADAERLVGAHWERLLAGRLLAPAVRVDWATPLQRTFQADVLACPKCSARIRVLGQVTEPAIVRLALVSVGLPTEVPRPARARDPTGLLAERE
jgi:hypothetical protein